MSLLARPPLTTWVVGETCVHRGVGDVDSSRANSTGSGPVGHHFYSLGSFQTSR